MTNHNIGGLPIHTSVDGRAGTSRAAAPFEAKRRRPMTLRAVQWLCRKEGK